MIGIAFLFPLALSPWTFEHFPGPRGPKNPRGRVSGPPWVGKCQKPSGQVSYYFIKLLFSPLQGLGEEFILKKSRDTLAITYMIIQFCFTCP